MAADCKDRRWQRNRPSIRSIRRRRRHSILRWSSAAPRWLRSAIVRSATPRPAAANALNAASPAAVRWTAEALTHYLPLTPERIKAAIGA
jgi:hypothetical protein